MALLTKASLWPSGEVTRSSTRSGVVAMARVPGVRSGCCSGSSFFLFHFGGRGCVAGESGRQVEREDGVAALGGAILHNIFPRFLVIVFLRLGPGLASGEVDRLRIGRPGEGVDIFFSLSHRESFAAVGRDEVNLGGGFVFRVRTGVGVRIRIRSGVTTFICGRLAFGEEGDPAAVGRPLGFGVVSRLRQLNQIARSSSAFGVVVIEPEIAAEDLLVPVGALGCDHNRVAVGRNLERREVDRVEELVERELGFALGDEQLARSSRRSERRRQFCGFALGSPGGRRVIQRRIRSKQVCDSGFRNDAIVPTTGR